MTITEIPMFIAFVFGPAAYLPMTFFEPVAQNSGMTANGMPTDSSTWLHTRLIVGFAPSAMMMMTTQIQ